VSKKNRKRSPDEQKLWDEVDALRATRRLLLGILSDAANDLTKAWVGGSDAALLACAKRIVGVNERYQFLRQQISERQGQYAMMREAGDG
jgi:hypothetical protein